MTQGHCIRAPSKDKTHYACLLYRLANHCANIHNTKWLLLSLVWHKDSIVGAQGENQIHCTYKYVSQMNLLNNVLKLT